jgi:ABC-type antimicrobial peptide transport system permease subunit
MAADPSFFEVFSFPLMRGNLDDFKEGVDKIIISDRLAKIFFGSEDPLGKTFIIANRDVEVVGVMKDVPTNSQLQFDYVMPIKFLEAIQMFQLEDWNFYFLQTYLRVDRNAGTDLSKKIVDVIRKNSNDRNTMLSLQPMADIHLKSGDISSDWQGKGDIMYVYLFAAIAVVVLLIAGINYSNLATARAIKRSKEVGVRKVLGSNRVQLAVYYFFESLVYAVVAFTLAVGACWLLLPPFNSMVDKQITFELFKLSIIGPLLLSIMLCAFFGGIYPALFLSAQNPTQVLKGAVVGGKRTISLRRALVIGQFVISATLLVGMLAVREQMVFIQNKDLGFDKKDVIEFTMIRKIRSNYGTIKNELLAIPGIQAVTASSESISVNESWTDEFDWAGKDPNSKPIFYQMAVDHDFVKFNQIQVVAGRDFSPDAISDSTAVMINEEAFKQMGIKEVINQRVKLHGVNYTIVGVAKNFHFTSVHKKIEPLIFFIDPTSLFQIAIKLSPDRQEEQIKAAEKVFKKFTPERPFDYVFLDAQIAKNYKTEKRVEKIFKYFAGLAVFISCLGLLGIVLFVSEQRAKEIAVRKVLGAPVFKLVELLTKEYFIMAIVGVLIAAPLVYFGLKSWLDTFAYKIDIGIQLFLMGGGITVCLAWTTVAYRAFRAASENPIKNLRNE